METSTNTRRRYSDTDVAQALAALDCNSGDIARTARVTGIPDSTLETWRDRPRAPVDPGLRERVKETLALRFQAIIAQAVGIIEDKLPQASAAQAAVIAGIATEKMLLLRGEATNITQHQDDELLAEFRARYGRLRGAIPITDATTTPPKPPEQPLPALPAPPDDIIPY